MKRKSKLSSESLTISLTPKPKGPSKRGAVTLYLNKDLFADFKKVLEKDLNRSPSEVIESFIKSYLEKD